MRKLLLAGGCAVSLSGMAWAAGGAEHGAAAAHHVSYAQDDDGDGTRNWADSDAGDAYVLGKLGFHALNFALFIGLLVWVGGGAVRTGLATRAMAIRTEIDEATKLHAEAKDRHDALQARLARLESEIADIHTAASAEGAAEEQRIEVRAREAAVRVAESAKRQIRDESTRARQELRREAVELAVELAEGIVRGQVQPADQRRLADEFLKVVQYADGGAAGGSHV